MVQQYNKGTAMSEADEIRELRKWLREDANRTSSMVSNLHLKIDDSILRNNEEHKDFMLLIADQVTKSEVNGTRIIGLASITSVIVSGLIFTAFQVLEG